MPNFTQYRITTDGEKFRVEGQHKPLSADVQWIPLTNDWYFGCASFGFYAPNYLTFNSKQEAIDFIRKEYGENGIRMLVKEWIPC